MRQKINPGSFIIALLLVFMFLSVIFSLLDYSNEAEEDPFAIYHMEVSDKSEPDIQAKSDDSEKTEEAVQVEPIEANGTEWTASEFKIAGDLYFDGIRYTWYSEKILPGDGLVELNSNGRSVSAEGYVIDKDSYIACASSDYPIGTELWSPLGYLKVYDNGPDSGTIDVYTSW